MSIDYEALRGTAAGPPDNGSYDARLERAALVETRNGEQLVTEWTCPEGAWTSWNRFDATGLPFAQELLDGLAVDRTKLTDDYALESELYRVTGQTYRVVVSNSKGSQGDRVFTNTKVIGPAAQTTDVPGDLQGLQGRGGDPQRPLDGQKQDEEDIPF